MDLDPTTLFASMTWGTIGMGLIMYGRKQTAPAPLASGAILIMASYFSESALAMSIISIVTLTVLYQLSKR